MADNFKRLEPGMIDHRIHCKAVSMFGIDFQEVDPSHMMKRLKLWHAPLNTYHTPSHTFIWHYKYKLQKWDGLKMYGLNILTHYYSLPNGYKQ